MMPTFSFRVACVLLYLLSFSLKAQSSLSASQAYEYLQGERKRADAVIGTGTNPPTDSLHKAEQILKDALTYYAKPDVQALAKNDRPLFFRKYDILFDLSAIQCQLNQLDQAAQSLQEPLKSEFASAYAGYIEKEAVFTPVRQHALIKPLLKQLNAATLVFNSKALATPYKPNLSQAEKVAGLSKLWSEAKYNFAHFDKIPDVDWDSVYLAFLPKVQATSSNVAYYRLLQQFYAQLHDGHTDVWASNGPLADSTSFRPPLVTQLIEGRVFVRQVRHDSLLRSGVVPGLEILKIDGMPVIDFANQYVRPYKSGSTPQNVDVQTYIYGLLRGPKDRPVRLTLKDASGKTTERVLPRSGYSALKPLPSFNLTILPGNVAYVQLFEFETDQAFKRFTAAFDSIAATNGLILDVRQNGGGDSGNGWNILGCLTDKSFPTGSYSSRKYSPLRRARGENVVYESVGSGQWSANGKKLYTKPVVVLTSGQTFSAAEDFCVAFDAMNRGKIIGEPTGGSTGQPLSFSLPGGIMARVCTKRDAYPDGTDWIGKGIQPDIVVKQTAADFQAGRDTVLEAALTELGYKETAIKEKKKKTK
jgi:C-terminal processing protease CtpA/Prc